MTGQNTSRDIRLAYLGPRGTFSEEALVRYLGDRQANVIPLATIPDVIKAVRDGHVDEAIVPLENSLEGTVNVALDMLVKAVEVNIRQEIIIPIRHHLLIKPGVKKEEIKTIISHPQALAQCRHYLSENLPGVAVRESQSTGEAAREVAGGPPGWAAVSNERAAILYKLSILDGDIQDCSDNSTRFVVLSRGETQPTGNDLTSIVFAAPHRPGGLFGILEEFASRNLNLTKIESRPAKKTLGEYLFFVDLEGHRSEPRVQEALEAVAGATDLFRVLGSYPRDTQRQNQAELSYHKNEQTHQLNHLRGEIDSIDRQIVELLAQRAEIVRKVGELKKNRRQVRDIRREEQIMNRLQEQAARRGLEPRMIEDIYRQLFDYFVAMQES